jgi:hypothetical protein
VAKKQKKRGISNQNPISCGGGINFFTNNVILNIFPLSKILFRGEGGGDYTVSSKKSPVSEIVFCERGICLYQKEWGRGRLSL